jgi:methylated-DNA-[protein]-cysteine S-methyltransferase
VTPLASTTVDTPIGTLTLVATVDGLREIRWPGTPPPHATHGPATPHLDQAATELTEYFAGRRQRFDVPLDLVGTTFQLRHWASLATIPYGTTTTYGALAARHGNRRGARAVGAANGRNPVPIVLPCHRVVGAGGSLTGFGGGLELKRFLLDLESRYR